MYNLIIIEAGSVGLATAVYAGSFRILKL